MLSLLSTDGYDAAGKAIARDVSGFRVSAEQRGAGGGAGGDFYTLAVRARGRIGVLIGDVCGRGPEARAQLARMFPRIQELALSGESPARLLAKLNSTVIAELALDSFVTAAAFELDLPAGLLTVANAAHVPAVVRRAGKVTIVGRASGAPLGFSADTTYVDECHSLLPHDVIVLMTDGVLEAVEANLSTMSTLRSSLANTRVNGAGVHRLLLQMFEACARGRQDDDMTLLTLEATNPPLAATARSTLPAYPRALAS